MVKALVTCLVVIGILAGLAIWRLNQTTDEVRIRNQLEHFSEYLSKDGDETPTQIAVKMNRLGQLFAESFVVELNDFPANGVYSANEVASQLARLRPAFDLIRVAFLDIDVTVSTPREATARVTARLNVRPKGGDTAVETREVTIALTRDDEQNWRFAAFTQSAVLTR